MVLKRKKSAGKKVTTKKRKTTAADAAALEASAEVHSDAGSSSEPGGDDAGGDDGEEDAFFETADERRVRLAKDYLAKLGGDGEGAKAEGVGVQEHLAQELAEEQRKVHRKITDIQLGEARFIKGHQYAATCVTLSADETIAFTGSKDCKIIRYDIETGKKDTFPGHRNDFSCGGHFQHVLGLWMVEQRNIFLSAGADRMVRVWDARVPKASACVARMHEHNGVVTSVVAEPDGNQAYSCSLDKSLRVWDLRTRKSTDALLGHVAGVTCMDIYSKNRPLTGSFDKVVRMWKVEKDTHIMFSKHAYSVDAVAVADNDRFLSGDQAGGILLWSGASKKPIAAASLGGAGQKWVTSLGAIRGGNVAFSGSTDATLRTWRFGREAAAADADSGEKGALTLSECMPAVEAPGVVNNVVVGKKTIACAIGKEHRLGRWFYDKKFKNGLLLVPLSYREN